jgi:hypothetical protein
MRRLRLALFAAVVASAALVGCAAAPPVDSGVRGTVTLGKANASQTTGVASAQPYSADLVIKPQGGRSSVARVKSDAAGRFSITLEPGTYVIRAASAKAPISLEPVTVTVVVHEFAEVTVPFDSGTQ